jgi:hypothetical protein
MEEKPKKPTLREKFNKFTSYFSRKREKSNLDKKHNIDDLTISDDVSKKVIKDDGEKDDSIRISEFDLSEDLVSLDKERKKIDPLRETLKMHDSKRSSSGISVDASEDYSEDNSTKKSLTRTSHFLLNENDKSSSYGPTEVLDEVLKVKARAKMRSESMKNLSEIRQNFLKENSSRLSSTELLHIGSMDINKNARSSAPSLIETVRYSDDITPRVTGLNMDKITIIDSKDDQYRSTTRASKSSLSEKILR